MGAERVGPRAHGAGGQPPPAPTLPTPPPGAPCARALLDLYSPAAWNDARSARKSCRMAGAASGAAPGPSSPSSGPRANCFSMLHVPAAWNVANTSVASLPAYVRMTAPPGWEGTKEETS